MQQLLGKETKKPRLKTPANLWRKVKENHDAIENKLLAIVPTVDTKVLAKTQDLIARWMFSELDQAAQQQWKRVASEEHSIAIEEYNAGLNQESSMTPEDHQQ